MNITIAALARLINSALAQARYFWGGEDDPTLIDRKRTLLQLEAMHALMTELTNNDCLGKDFPAERFFLVKAVFDLLAIAKENNINPRRSYQDIPTFVAGEDPSQDDVIKRYILDIHAVCRNKHDQNWDHVQFFALYTAAFRVIRTIEVAKIKPLKVEIPKLKSDDSEPLDCRTLLKFAFDLETCAFLMRERNIEPAHSLQLFVHALVLKKMMAVQRMDPEVPAQKFFLYHNLNRHMTEIDRENQLNLYSKGSFNLSSFKYQYDYTFSTPGEIFKKDEIVTELKASRGEAFNTIREAIAKKNMTLANKVRDYVNVSNKIIRHAMK